MTPEIAEMWKHVCEKTSMAWNQALEQWQMVVSHPTVNSSLKQVEMMANRLQVEPQVLLLGASLAVASLLVIFVWTVSQVAKRRAMKNEEPIANSETIIKATSQASVEEAQPEEESCAAVPEEKDVVMAQEEEEVDSPVGDTEEQESLSEASSEHESSSDIEEEEEQEQVKENDETSRVKTPSPVRTSMEDNLFDEDEPAVDSATSSPVHSGSDAEVTDHLEHQGDEEEFDLLNSKLDRLRNLRRQSRKSIASNCSTDSVGTRRSTRQRRAPKIYDPSDDI